MEKLKQMAKHITGYGVVKVLFLAYLLIQALKGEFDLTLWVIFLSLLCADEKGSKHEMD